jgi:hypothetical protein
MKLIGYKYYRERKEKNSKRAFRNYGKAMARKIGQVFHYWKIDFLKIKRAR